MDALSDICASLRLVGGVHFRCALATPWGMDIGAQCEGMFHLIETGECWLRMAPLAAPLHLRRGDLVVVPHGHRHALVDSPDGEAIAAQRIVGVAMPDGYGPVFHGSGEARAEFLCGYFRFDRRHPHPIVQALPPLIHLRVAAVSPPTVLASMLALITQETRAPRPGSQAVVNRLVEALFIQVVRSHLDDCKTPAGVLAAVADRQVSRALRLIHSQPGQAWTLDSLAVQAGCSRSVLALRFRRLVGRTPIDYLRALRMQTAQELLATGRASTAAVAGQVGYASESSFAKAFKKATGLGPGGRRRMRPASGPDDSTARQDR